MLKKRILLASASPRRRELLRLITPDFDCVSADVDETLPNGISPSDAVLYLSKIKAYAFAPDSRIIIGADTVVALENRIIGKPKDAEDAFHILRLLSGREHSVFTGVTIIAGARKRSFFRRPRFIFICFRMRRSGRISKRANVLTKPALTVYRGRVPFWLKR